MAYGIVNADQISTSVSGSSLGAGNASLLKNRLINGNMVIDQRNAGASVTQTTANPLYTLDRWAAYGSVTSKFTVQQNAGSVTPPTGFTNYLGVTSSSAYSVGSSDYFGVQQAIEGFNVSDLAWGTANAKTVTLSFQVYSSLTGTFGGSLRNNDVSRSYPFTYTISSANTWTPISITITGDTTGTWVTNNGIGIRVWFGLGAGSTFSGTAGSWASANYNTATGATSVVGTNGATFYITGVQLEVGSSATGYEYRQYGQELALCQRYYTKMLGTGAYEKAAANGWYNSSTSGYMVFIMPVTMRTSPTLTSSVGTYAINTVIAGGAVTGFSVDQTSLTSPSYNFTVASGGTANQYTGLQSQGSTSAYIGFSAEL